MDRTVGVWNQGVGDANSLCVYTFIPASPCRRTGHCADGAHHQGQESDRGAVFGTCGTGWAMRWPINRAIPGPGPTTRFRRLPWDKGRWRLTFGGTEVATAAVGRFSIAPNNAPRW